MEDRPRLNHQSLEQSAPQTESLIDRTATLFGRRPLQRFTVVHGSLTRANVPDAVRKLGVAEQTSHRWKQDYGGLVFPVPSRLYDPFFRHE
jgi:hypothetical protein